MKEKKRRKARNTITSEVVTGSPDGRDRTYPLRLTPEQHEALRIQSIRKHRPLSEIIRERLADLMGGNHE
ncbi:MAG: hypothetical protein K8T26_01575 [Lentisphaerae bacterium]|nr:hypothetical protein [Lentisphaerota bacterium]